MIDSSWHIDLDLTFMPFRVEQNVYPLLRIRDLAIAQYKDLSIPSEWMLDSGLIGKVYTDM